MRQSKSSNCQVSKSWKIIKKRFRIVLFCSRDRKQPSGAALAAIPGHPIINGSFPKIGSQSWFSGRISDIDPYMRSSCIKPYLSTFWRFFFFVSAFFFFYKCFPIRSKTMFKLDKTLLENFWKKSKNVLVVEKSTPKDGADLQNRPITRVHIIPKCW